MSDDIKTKMSGSVDISADNSPGGIMVEIVRSLFAKGASIVATVALEKIFSGGVAIEDVLFGINARGLKVAIAARIQIQGHTSDKGEIDPPVVLAEVEESITVQPGMLQTVEVTEDEPEPQGGGLIH